MLYYKRHIGDYIRDTAHLSLLEHGVYARLMDVYYGREKPLSDTDAVRLIKAQSRAEVKAVKTVLNEFWTHTQEGWIQGRCDDDIQRARGKAEVNQENGKKGGRPRKGKSHPQPRENPNGSDEKTQTVSFDNPNVTLSNNPTIQSSNQIPPTPLTGGQNGAQAPAGRRPRASRDRSRDVWQSVTVAVDSVKGTDLTWRAVSEQIADPYADNAIESVGGHKLIADRTKFNAGDLESRFRHVYEVLIEANGAAEASP